MESLDLPTTPLTDETFMRQGWERHEFVDDEAEDDETGAYHYWILPLPKDNPDGNAPVLISSTNDEWEMLELNEGEFSVEIFELNGLGHCECEEQLELLYMGLCGYLIEESK